MLCFLLFARCSGFQRSSLLFLGGEFGVFIRAVPPLMIHGSTNVTPNHLCHPTGWMYKGFTGTTLHTVHQSCREKERRNMYVCKPMPSVSPVWSLACVVWSQVCAV